MKVQKEIFYGSVVALVLALLPLPYAYYMLLRIGMCGVFAYLASVAWQAKHQGLTWVLGITAMIYNPLAPLHLGREVWLMVNIATIALLLFVKSKSCEDGDPSTEKGENE